MVLFAAWPGLLALTRGFFWCVCVCLQARDPVGMTPVHLLCLDTRDSPKDAVDQGANVLALARLVNAPHAHALTLEPPLAADLRTCAHYACHPAPCILLSFFLCASCAAVAAAVRRRCVFASGGSPPDRGGGPGPVSAPGGARALRPRRVPVRPRLRIAQAGSVPVDSARSSAKDDCPVRTVTVEQAECRFAAGG